ncbi:TonB-dependent receptor [Marivirga lumbricoides]|uniref:TonB-dependent receptor n=1 Tax=Marivirga lumbricoides TaxID=1046115 RepID=A0ABQ1N339_9BACT|nr:TonB-dependent receptor [Marivirga lumbricoides]
MKKVARIVCVVSVALLISRLAVGQISILVEDNAGKPIHDAIVQVTAFNQPANKGEMLWTNQQGVVNTGINPSFIIEISNLGYHTLRDTIRTATSTVVYKLAPKKNYLKEVVVTGLYEATSAKNAVYQVRTVDAKVIASMGANSLEEVLSQQLNIRFSRDNAIGNGSISMQGLSGQYVKILIDGVPVVGRSGTANEIDVNQIDVQMIDRVEIVEGPMAVNYGADALAGVINIITKKGGDQSLYLKASVQEETVGKEYSLWDEGIHNYSVSVGGQLLPKLSADVQSRWIRFGGWTGVGEGRDKEWYPKNQWLNNAGITFTQSNWHLRYQLNHLQEEIFNLGTPNTSNPLKDPFALDQKFLAKRWMHQLQGEFNLGKWKLHSANSYTEYERLSAQYNTNLITNTETPSQAADQDTIFYNSWFSRNTFQGQLFATGRIMANAQLGLEAKYEQGGGTTLSDGTKEMYDVALFASSEIKIHDRLKVRPGIRYTYNSSFKTLPTPAVNIKYDVSSELQLRMGYGRGFRAPSVREMYHEFIDSNHNIIGNEALTPETSHSFTANIDYHPFNYLKLSIGGFHNNIKDKIGFFTPERADLATTYRNISTFKTQGINSALQYTSASLNAQIGASYIGRYQKLNEDEPATVPEFIYSPEVNFSLQYEFEKIGLTPAVYYKFTGANKDYRLVTNEEGESVPELQKIDPFHWLDLTITQSFSSNLSMSAGIKNILNIETVNNNLRSGGVHGGSQTAQTSVAYGRSFFIRMQYQFSKSIKSINK